MGQRLALVHDYLTQRGGAERVVATWCAGFPNAPLYTSLYDPAATFEAFRQHPVHASWLNAIGPLRRHHRYALPLLAPTMSAWRVDADVVLASSSGWAHGVRTSGRLLVYCHAPARWLYQSDRYLGARSLGHAAEVAAQLLEAPLRRWDHRAAARATRYLANSTATATALAEIYGIEAEVLAPPVAVPAAQPLVERTTDVLVISRLLPYKNLDTVLAAARAMPDASFVIVGGGPLRAQLAAAAPKNVTLRGVLSDDELWREYASARVSLALSHEDFGLSVLEAASAGVPTVARGDGGYLDTVTEETGVLVDPEGVTVAAVCDALRDTMARSWDGAVLRAHAESFSPERHLSRLRAVIAELAPS